MPDQAQRTPIGAQYPRHGFDRPDQIVWEAKVHSEAFPRMICLAGGEIYTGDGTVAPTVLFGSALGLQGPKGDPGDPGAKGDTGDPGTNGLNGSPGAAGTNGSPGAAGIDGRTIYSGTTLPSSGLGANGDFYIRNPSTAPALYGPKAAGAWGASISMVGPQGATGATGPAGPAGPGGSVDLAALTARVAILEGLGFYNVENAVNVVGNDSTDCTSGLQGLINAFGGFGVAVRLRFNATGGKVYRHTGLDIPFSSIYLEGLGRDSCSLDYRGSGAKRAVRWHGTDEGDYSGRIEHGGALHMTFTNHGSQDSVGFVIDNATDMLFDHIRWEGFRGQGSCIRARNWADSDLMEVAADFCGGIEDTDLDWALFDLSGEADGEWACDRIRWWGGRIENCAGRIFDCRAANDHFVAKILLVGTKIENSVLASNGFGGSEIEGAAFYLSQVLDFTYLAAEVTLQGIRDDLGWVVPRMFHLDSCYGVTIQGHVSMGAIDDATQVFETLFDIDGGRGIEIDVKLNNGDTSGASLPDQVFKFGGGATNIYRDGSMWVFDASGDATITDVGSFTNDLMWNDTLDAGRQFYSEAKVLAGDYVVQAEDAGKTLVVISSGTVNVTIPSGLFATTQGFRVICEGTGVVNIITSGGVTLERPPSTPLSLHQFESLTIYQRFPNFLNVVASNFGPGDRTLAVVGIGTKNLDWFSADVFVITLTGNTTLTFSNVSASTKTLVFKQAGAGGYTVTWPATVKWPAGTPPTIETAIGDDTVISLFHDGVTQRGALVGAQYA